MSEHELVAATSEPRTKGSLATDLRALGLAPGMVVIVHSSLRSLGWVCGGPVAAVLALMDVVTREGTIVMPTQSSDLSDPSRWRNPPVPASWQQTIRDSMPAYDPQYTPTRHMGAIVETFRSFPDVARSGHPALSFAAWGRHRDEVIRDHSLHYSLGEHSPLARVYDLDGWVLLLGAGYGSSTSFHLAEYRVPNPAPEIQGAPIMQDGKRVWAEIRDIEIDAEPFPRIGADFEHSGQVTKGKVGSAECMLFRQRPAVDFAVDWLTRKKGV